MIYFFFICCPSCNPQCLLAAELYLFISCKLCSFQQIRPTMHFVMFYSLQSFAWNHIATCPFSVKLLTYVRMVGRHESLWLSLFITSWFHCTTFHSPFHDLFFTLNVIITLIVTFLQNATNKYWCSTHLNWNTFQAILLLSNQEVCMLSPSLPVLLLPPQCFNLSVPMPTSLASTMCMEVPFGTWRGCMWKLAFKNSVCRSGAGD